MNNAIPLWLYVLVMALVTYGVRMLPLALVRRKIRSRFVRSFLHYVPYAVLSAMTIPAIFYAAADIPSAAVGFGVAAVLSWRGRSLLTVAVAACAAAYLVSLLIGLVF